MALLTRVGSRIDQILASQRAQIEAKVLAEAEGERVELGKQIAAIEERAAKAAPDLSKAVLVAKEAVEQARENLRLAEQRFNESHAAAMGASFQTDAAKGQLVRRLADLAPLAVEDLREWLRDVDLRVIAESRVPPLDPDKSNRSTARARAAAVQDECGRLATRRAEVWQMLDSAAFVARPDAAIAKQIAEIRTEFSV